LPRQPAAPSGVFVCARARSPLRRNAPVRAQQGQQVHPQEVAPTRGRIVARRRRRRRRRRCWRLISILMAAPSVAFARSAVAASASAAAASVTAATAAAARQSQRQAESFVSGARRVWRRSCCVATRRLAVSLPAARASARSRTPAGLLMQPAGRLSHANADSDSPLCQSAPPARPPAQ